MKKLILLGAAVAVLAGCSQSVPDSGAGFSDYSQYELERAQREAALNGSLPAAPAVSGGPISSGTLAQAGINGDTALYPVTPQSTDGRVEATPGNAAPAIVSNSGISDEQDFDAVAGRESIESDAQRREQQAAQYQVVEGAVPIRQNDSGPNIVEYALNAPNSLGQEWYSRFKFSGQGRYERNCSKYTSSDEAQRDFLARGGPERDPRGIDPDGDGFACAWDPAPFRLARSQQGN